MATDIYYAKNIRDLINSLNLGHKECHWAINIDLFCALSWGSVNGKAETKKTIMYYDRKQKLHKVTYRFDKANVGHANKFKAQLMIKWHPTGSSDDVIYGHMIEMLTIFDPKTTVNSNILDLHSEYKKAATFGNMSCYLDNEETLKSVYSESPEYMIAQRFRTMYNEIESLQTTINDVTENMLLAEDAHSKKIMELNESHRVTLGHYQRQLEQYKKYIADAHKLNDALLRQQVDNIKLSSLVVYKIVVDDIMAIFDLELRGGTITKNSESLKFIEEALEDTQAPYTLYYITDGYDKCYAESYANTYNSLPNFIGAWDTNGSTKTILFGSRKMVYTMIGVGDKSVISFDDPCKLFAGTHREKIIEQLGTTHEMTDD